MEPMDRQTAKKHHQERITKLMGKTIIDEKTAFDVLDESTVHLIDHFNPPQNERAAHDCVLIIGAAYLGIDRNDESKGVRAYSFFAAGNMHELAHAMADVMHEDKAFASTVFHAMEVFALHEKRTPNNIG